MGWCGTWDNWRHQNGWLSNGWCTDDTVVWTEENWEDITENWEDITDNWEGSS